MPINYVKKHLTTYVPNMVMLIGSNLDWDKINMLFNKKLEKRKIYDVGRKIEVCIYDVIVKAMKNEAQASRYLDFLNQLFRDLSITLTDTEKKLLSKNIYNMLISFDLKYLDYLGEIAVLNNLMKSKEYQLINVEQVFPNGKKIDFIVKRIVSSELILVEIYNIHLDDDRVEPNKEAIKKFLEDRLIAKINQKQTGLKGKREFIIVPVLWGSGEALKIYYDFFQTESIQIDKINEPFVYGTFIEKNGNYLHRFCKISNFLKSNISKPL